MEHRKKQIIFLRQVNTNPDPERHENTKEVNQEKCKKNWALALFNPNISLLHISSHRQTYVLLFKWNLFFTAVTTSVHGILSDMQNLRRRLTFYSKRNMKLQKFVSQKIGEGFFYSKE